jgi:hypothetical protein
MSARRMSNREHRAVKVDPDWRSALNQSVKVDPDWDLEFGRIIVADFGSRGPTVQTLW